MKGNYLVGLSVSGALALGCGHAQPVPRPQWATASAVDRDRLDGDNYATPESSRSQGTNENPFFQMLGTNGRTCATCHHQDQGWTITPSFARSAAPTDPLFLFDGSNCLGPGVANPDPAHNSTEMLGYGNVRIELAVPASSDYVLTEVVDPLDCPSPPTAGALRVYRRPLPVANSAFLATVMWDGRENVAPSIQEDLEHQANSATIVHAQADHPLTTGTRQRIVGFVTHLFDARRRIGDLSLSHAGAHGGPAFLETDTLTDFHLGINDPFEPGFSNEVFTLYRSWEPGASAPAPSHLAESIGRGEVIFNRKQLTVADVPGLNGPHDASREPLHLFCGSCHNSPNVGNHSGMFSVDIGATAVGPAGDLDVSHLPAYTFQEKGTGRTIKVTDPGRGAITGRFADLGKTKVPTLRGLAARAPYFHNGSAPDLASVVNFYDRRFDVGFTDQERADLIAFLGAL
jgi:cytochrome c peroxidase